LKEPTGVRAALAITIAFEADIFVSRIVIGRLAANFFPPTFLALSWTQVKSEMGDLGQHLGAGQDRGTNATPRKAAAAGPELPHCTKLLDLQELCAYPDRRQNRYRLLIRGTPVSGEEVDARKR
jgi:hypothetical protein